MTRKQNAATHRQNDSARFWQNPPPFTAPQSQEIAELVGLLRRALQGVLANWAVREPPMLPHWRFDIRGNDAINISQRMEPAYGFMLTISFKETDEYKALRHFVTATTPMAQYFAIDGRGEVIPAGPMSEDRALASITNVILSYLLDAKSTKWNEAAFSRTVSRLREDLLKPSFTHRISLYMLAKGPDEAISLPGGVILRRLELMEREALYQILRDRPPILGDTSNAAHVKTVLECRFELPRGRSLGFLPIDTDKYRMALRLACEKTIGVFLPTQRIEALATSAIEYPIGRARSTNIVGDQEITSDNVKRAITVFTMLDGEPTNVAETALSRLDFSTDRERPQDRFLDLVIGLESIVSDGEVDGLSFKFRQRLAALIGTSVSDRRAIFDSARTIYGARSKVAHGDKLTKPLDEITELAESYLRRGIVALLETPRYRKASIIDDELLCGECRFITAASSPICLSLASRA